jgi:hypothetical protein
MGSTNPDKRQSDDFADGEIGRLIPFRSRLRGALQNSGRVQSEENPNNQRKWADVSKLLFALNPEYAQICLDKLSKIDPTASTADKTDRIMQILAEYSPDTEIHCTSIKEMIEREGEFVGKPGFSAFSGIDFQSFADAMERHDIGKVGMPKSILDPASGMLYGQRERTVKETHPIVGYLILKKLGFDVNTQRFSLTHHLRYKTDESGAVILSGYPREEFIRFCEKNSLSPKLRTEDHLAAFTDVFAALTDQKHRRSNVHGMDFQQSEMDVCLQALEKMSTNKAPDLFADDYYQKGEGRALFEAFAAAMIEIARKGGPEIDMPKAA